MWDQQGPLSPQLDEPVEDEEHEKAEEEHVAQELGLAASGELLDPADGGAQQAARGVKVWVLERITTDRNSLTSSQAGKQTPRPTNLFNS